MGEGENRRTGDGDRRGGIGWACGGRGLVVVVVEVVVEFVGGFGVGGVGM
jgi:hypothetical protein